MCTCLGIKLGQNTFLLSPTISMFLDNALKKGPLVPQWSEYNGFLELLINSSKSSISAMFKHSSQETKKACSYSPKLTAGSSLLHVLSRICSPKSETIPRIGADFLSVECKTHICITVKSSIFILSLEGRKIKQGQFTKPYMTAVKFGAQDKCDSLVMSLTER